MTIFSGQTYLEKHRFCKNQVKTAPNSDLRMVIVIPCHGERGLLDTLNSLENCKHAPVGVEVIIVLNASEKATPELLELNDASKRAFQEWNSQPRTLARYFLLDFPQLPRKHAGVGLARKIGMDEAVSRFEQVGTQEGIIVCLDADSLVSPNYLCAIWEHFVTSPKYEACSIRFEHPLSGKEFELDVYRGIIHYELFLRYYIEALRYAGHPYAFHTIGSSMAVRSIAYEKQNGMNRRKAGEDFYFLMKFIVDGKLNELLSTCVYPSPRPADHVPFGTGRAILKWLEGDRKTYPGYDLRIFKELKEFLDQVPSLYEKEDIDIPVSIQQYLIKENFQVALKEIKKHVTSPQAFVKRFYKWFNGLRTLKYVHYARDNYYPDQDLVNESRALHSMYQGDDNDSYDAKQLLLAYRDKQSTAY